MMMTWFSSLCGASTFLVGIICLPVYTLDVDAVKYIRTFSVIRGNQRLFVAHYQSISGWTNSSISFRIPVIIQTKNCFLFISVGIEQRNFVFMLYYIRLPEGIRL